MLGSASPCVASGRLAPPESRALQAASGGAATWSHLLRAPFWRGGVGVLEAVEALHNLLDMIVGVGSLGVTPHHSPGGVVDVTFQIKLRNSCLLDVDIHAVYFLRQCPLLLVEAALEHGGHAVPLVRRAGAGACGGGGLFGMGSGPSYCIAVPASASRSCAMAMRLGPMGARSHACLQTRALWMPGRPNSPRP